MGGKNAAVLFAPGFEEIEGLAAVDYMRRAGISVTMCGIGGKEVTGFWGIKITADMLLEEYIRDSGEKLPDMVVIPGGMPGAENVGKSEAAGELIRSMFTAGRFTAAICAAPAVVLAPLGVLKNRRYTCYPGMEGKIEQWCGPDWRELTEGSRWLEDRVVRDGNLITSKGPGTAEEFAFELIRALESPEKAASVAEWAIVRS